MSIVWKADVYVTQDGRFIERPRNRSISEMEDMERQDWERNRYSGARGLMFAAAFALPFWLLGIYVYFLRYYR